LTSDDNCWYILGFGSLCLLYGLIGSVFIFQLCAHQHMYDKIL